MKNKVKETRLSLEISQTRLAELCGVSRQTIHAIEISKYQPTVILALKISKHLNQKVEDIFKLEKGD